MRNLVTTFGFSIFCIPVFAQEPIAELPQYKVADYWTYNVREERSGKSDIWTRTIIDITPEGNLRTANLKNNLYDAAFNPISPNGPDYNIVPMKFPLKVGSKWTYTKKFDPVYPLLNEEGAFEVVSLEFITVPAGTFSCFKIKGDRRRDSKYYALWIESMRWYCPEVKNVAKMIIKTIERPPTGLGRFDTEYSELTQTNYLLK
jgi:hypothetical protein